MHNILYILSNEFDYSKLICSDAGPEYAMDMGWNYNYLSNIDLYRNVIFVIDNRISENECLKVESYIVKNLQLKIIFTIIDPYYENRENYYYQLLKRLYNCDNVLFISKYQLVEWVLDLETNEKRKKILWLPYPYLIENEVQIKPLVKRKSKIIFSGAINSIHYPFRYNFWRNNVHSFSRVFIKFFRHAGYSDVGNIRNHDVIGSRFVLKLSEYKFMFLCPSRCGIEFLKYRECAYAGCVPIGKLPKSLLGKVELVNQPDKLGFFQLLKILFLRNRSLIKYSEEYRSFYRSERNPKLLNWQLSKFLYNHNWIDKDEDSIYTT